MPAIILRVLTQLLNQFLRAAPAATGAAAASAARNAEAMKSVFFHTIQKEEGLMKAFEAFRRVGSFNFKLFENRLFIEFTTKVGKEPRYAQQVLHPNLTVKEIGLFLSRCSDRISQAYGRSRPVSPQVNSIIYAQQLVRKYAERGGGL